MRALLVLFAIAGAVGAVGLSLAGAVSVRADIFNIAWPLQLACGLAALGVLLGVRKPRWRRARLAGITCAAALVLAGTPWAMLAPQDRPDAEPALSVTTFNSWASNSDPGLAEAVLRDSGADIVALQEIGLNSAGLPDRLSDLYPHQLRCRWGVRLISRRAFTASGCSDQLPAGWARIEAGGQEVTVLGAIASLLFNPINTRSHSIPKYYHPAIASPLFNPIITRSHSIPKSFLHAIAYHLLNPIITRSHSILKYYYPLSLASMSNFPLYIHLHSLLSLRVPTS